MGTSIPRKKTELKGTNRPGEVKTYKLTPEELATLAPAKPIPRSHHKPMGFSTTVPKDKTEGVLREKNIHPEKSKEKTSKRGRPAKDKKITEAAATKTKKPSDTRSIDKTDKKDDTLTVVPPPVVVEEAPIKEPQSAAPALLTRLEAEALEKAIATFDRDGVLMRSVSQVTWVGEFEPLAKVSITAMARALYAGYTAKETPEEKILTELSKLEQRFKGKGQRIEDYSEGMLFVIQTFNLKIPGLMPEVS